jgi:ribosome-associated protein
MRIIHPKFLLLNPTSVLPAQQRRSVNKLTRNSKIFKTIIKAIRDKKASRVVSLDLKKIPEAVVDYFVICEASTHVQIRAIAESVEDMVKKQVGEIPYRHEGRHSSNWVLIDYINVVVHVMHPEQRKFYRLEEMWSDGVLHEHDE